MGREKHVRGAANGIVRRDRLDNYWHMGIPGPGGPCSEIFVDRGPEYGPDGGPTVVSAHIPLTSEVPPA